MNRFKAKQHIGELRDFVALLQEQKVRSYLEIGSCYGGSLWWVGSSLPAGMCMVAVDKPKDAGMQQSLQSCAKALQQRHKVTVLFGDSTHDTIIARARALGPFDALFIDANHAREYVEKDWNNYGPLARIVCFHDISWKRDARWRLKHPEHARVDVPQFWDMLKRHYTYIEIKRDPTGNNNGIGMLWREKKCS